MNIEELRKTFLSDSPLQRGKANKSLDTKWNYDGKIQTVREMIEDAIEQGASIEERKDVAVSSLYRGGRNERVQKVLYSISIGTEGVYWEITKTAYNYAQHVKRG